MRQNFFPAVTIAVCLVVAIFFIQLIYSPLQSEISSLQMETRRLQAVEQNLNEFKRRHGELEKFSALTEKRLYEAQKFLPATPAQDIFVAELYRIAEKNNVLINSVQIGELETVDEKVEDKKIIRQNIRLNIAADYFSTLNFLREILNGSRLATLEKISLESGENILNGELELSIFNLGASS